jgi:dTDP-4-dehydrorhamnose reductase
MQRILVTGASGLLGSKVAKLAEHFFQVFPTHNARPFFKDSTKMDITNEREVSEVVVRMKPDFVMHVGAETRVDHCEKNRETAWKVNAEGTRNVAAACGRIHAKLIYVSTDYVFDGEKGFYIEDDEPNPLNHYGWTKLKGEKFVSEYCQEYVIARTSVLYGWHSWKTNFALWVVESLRNRKPITVVNDHFNCPTLADNLAEVLLEMVRKDLSGVFHTAGSERISRYDFAVEIAKSFDLDASMITPIEMSELKAWIAKRPRDSSLCIGKAQKQLKTKFLDVQEGLRIMRMKQGAGSVSFMN